LTLIYRAKTFHSIAAYEANRKESHLSVSSKRGTKQRQSSKIDFTFGIFIELVATPFSAECNEFLMLITFADPAAT
jgi:hypothetical protein